MTAEHLVEWMPQDMLFELSPIGHLLNLLIVFQNNVMTKFLKLFEHPPR